MSKRRLVNLLKRRFSFPFGKLASSKKIGHDQWFCHQLKDFSRLGGQLIVMKMG
ncbi:MAG TPA: hypothetical protein VMW25_05040 [Clostridia bacterium]|nr:hypothetical protein [Clostridia bacterium]